jgi:pimeloyl-ACP methyl ester carboxylesterase
MKVLRLIGLVVVVVAVLAAGWVLAARAGLFNVSYDKAVAEFAAPPSTFITVDGVKVHVRDEGTGPAVLMLHSSMANLHIWDAWADVLKTNHRVVRIDWPPYGVTVDDSGQAGTPRAAQIVAGVVDQLKLEHVILVGSSSGATLSVFYAANHPDKVRAMALSTLPLKSPPGMKVDPEIARWTWLHANLFPNYYPKRYWRRFLETLYAEPSKITDAQVRMFADTNNIAGGYARVNRYLKSNVKGIWSTGAGSFADKITVPILLQWGDADPVLPPYLAAEAVQTFRNAKVTVIHYHQGHYPQLEDPAPTAKDLTAFIDALPPIAPATASPQ